MNKKWMRTAVLGAAFFAALVFSCPGEAAVVEAEPDLQHVMGDLYALSAAMRLYYDDTHKAQCPSLDLLEPYLKKPLPDAWRQTYRTETVEGGWWVGRQVPEFSRARKFLRSNASALGLYDKDSMSAWLGGPFVWIEAVGFEKGKPGGGKTLHVVPGEDGRHLF
ncbi:MAG: hypothetical protein LBS00_10175, partial [Synergistaceae bacterium]|nr:hypothetical protein [Synergistaceae bacterium]